MLESKVVEVTEDPKSEQKINDKPKSRPEAVDELAPQQEKFPSWYTEVDELCNKTSDLPPEPTMKIVPSLVAMKTSLLLRPPDEYDPLQICLQEIGLQDIMLLMMPSAVGSVFIMNDVPQSTIGTLI